VKALICLKNLNIFRKGKWEKEQNILIGDGRVIKIGKFKAPGGVKIFDFGKDAIALPGFIDSHSHLASWGLKFLLTDLKETSSLKEVLELIANELKKVDKGELLIFEGFDQSG